MNIDLNNMNALSSLHKPYWIASTSKTNYPTLNQDLNVDVVIIGGGMVGITSAFLLREKGLRVAILEANSIAHGTSGHTTAKITSQHNLIYDRLRKTMGQDKAAEYAEANETAIYFIANLVKEKNIDCDFGIRPAYVYTQAAEYISKIEAEVEAASSLGIKANYLDKLSLPFDIKAAVCFENQAQFHPLKYLLSLASEIPGDAGYIFEHTKVVDIHPGKNCEVVTSNGFKVTASNVIIASHFPCYDGLGMYFTRIYAEKSYVLGVKIKDYFPKGMYISAENPGRSLRSQIFEDSELILVGGEHHKTGSEKNTNIHYENLEDFAKETFDLQSILFRWSTQDCMTVDGVPYIGRLTPELSNIFVATGFGKWGMTNSTASAMILKDLITIGHNPWESVYNPSRFTIVASSSKFISNSLDVAAKFISGKISIVPSDEEIRKIKNGEAKIVNVDGVKIGTYRDNLGNLHMADITCTHLGCELVWNEAEKSWDCPCHGSRFSFDGDNIEGPAFIPLNHPGGGPNKKDANIL